MDKLTPHQFAEILEFSPKIKLAHLSASVFSHVACVHDKRLVKYSAYVFAIEDVLCPGFLSALRFLKLANMPPKHIKARDVIMLATFNDQDTGVCAFLKNWVHNNSDGTKFQFTFKNVMGYEQICKDATFNDLPQDVTPLDFSGLVPDSVFLCVGPRRCGKTTLVTKLLNAFMGKARHVVLVGDGLDQTKIAHKSSTKIETLCNRQNWDDHLEQIMDDQEQHRSHGRLIVVFDDTGGVGLATEQMKRLFYNCRFRVDLGITIIVTIEYSIQLLSNFWTDVRYLFASPLLSRISWYELCAHFRLPFYAVDMVKWTLPHLQNYQHVVFDCKLNTKPTTFLVK